MEERTASVVRQADSRDLAALQATLSTLVQRLLLEADSLVEVTNYVVSSLFPAVTDPESTALLEEALIDSIWQADQDVEHGFLHFSIPNLDPAALKLANAKATQRIAQFLKSLTVRIPPRSTHYSTTYAANLPSRSSSSRCKPASRDSNPIPSSRLDYSISTSPDSIVKSFKPKLVSCAFTKPFPSLYLRELT